MTSTSRSLSGGKVAHKKDKRDLLVQRTKGMLGKEQEFEPWEDVPDAPVSIDELYYDLELVYKGRTHVFRARRRDNDQLRALKVYPPDTSQYEVFDAYNAMARVRNWIFDEAKNPEMFVNCIPTVYGLRDLYTSIYDQTSSVCEMEFIDGVSLADYISSRVGGRNIPLEDWLKFCEHTFMLLLFMHTMGYTHGSLTMGHIMITRGENGKLPSFKNLPSRYVLLHFERTHPRGFKSPLNYALGDPRYIAPEMIGFTYRNTDLVDWMDSLEPHDRWMFATLQDVFALSTVLFNLLPKMRFSVLQFKIETTFVAHHKLTSPKPAKDEALAKEMRTALRQVFTPELFAANFKRIVDVSGISEEEAALIRPFYDATIGAPFASRLSANEAFRLVNKILKQRKQMRKR